MSEQNVENIVQENEALRSKVNVLEKELALANQQLEWFRKQIFGRKTEQSSVIMDGGDIPIISHHPTASIVQSWFDAPE